MGCEVFNETDIAMIEGCRQTIQINIYNLMSKPIAITASSIEWRMSRYGETECLLSKNSEDNRNQIWMEDNILTIELQHGDTIGLFGKFTHQVTITDTKGYQFVLDLGKISIKPKIQ